MTIRSLATAFAVLACACASIAQEPLARLALARNSAGDVIASVTGSVRACGLSAVNGEPVVHADGATIEIRQPVAGVACMNPPPQSKPYAHSVNLGRLAPGTYSIHWTFPDLSTTYTVPKS